MADLIGDLMKQVKGEPKKAPGKEQETQKQEPEEKPEEVTQFIEKLNNLTRSIRTLEERYNNLRRRTQLTDHNILVQHQRLNKELKLNDSDLIDIKRGLQKLNDKINLLQKELELCGKKQDLDILAKYIGYWTPLKFITRNEAEKIIQAALTIKSVPEPETPKKKKKQGERSIY